MLRALRSKGEFLSGIGSMEASCIVVGAFPGGASPPGRAAACGVSPPWGPALGGGSDSHLPRVEVRTNQGRGGIKPRT